MRYDILKLNFSLKFSMEEEKVAPSGTIPLKVHGKTANFRMSYLMVYTCYPFKIAESNGSI